MYVPYTYVVGWSKHDRWYYGVEYANNKKRTANPANLFKIYFTSSKHVHEMVKKHGAPDVIVIRKTFVDKDSARRWEERVLKRLGVVGNQRWLNKTDNASIEFDRTSEEYLTKMRKPKKQYTISDRVLTARADRVEKLRGKKRPPRTVEWSSAIAAAKKGTRWFNNGTEEYYGNECRDGFVSGRLPKSTGTCSHCLKTMDVANLARYHGERCKFNTRDH